MVFVECYTRQRICREPWHSAKQPRGTTLGRHFAECLTADTLQSFKLCRVSASGTRQSAGPGWRHVAALPSARNPTLGKNPFAVGGFAEWRLSSVTLGKEFAECKLAFAECNRHSAKPVNPVVTVGREVRGKREGGCLELGEDKPINSCCLTRF